MLCASLRVVLQVAGQPLCRRLRARPRERSLRGLHGDLEKLPARLSRAGSKRSDAGLLERPPTLKIGGLAGELSPGRASCTASGGRAGLTPQGCCSENVGRQGSRALSLPGPPDPDPRAGSCGAPAPGDGVRPGAPAPRKASSGLLKKSCCTGGGAWSAGICS